jgi:hypothetical protein
MTHDGINLSEKHPMPIFKAGMTILSLGKI